VANKKREILASIDSRHIGVTDRGAATLRHNEFTAFSGDAWDIPDSFYTLDQEDNGKLLVFTSAIPVTVTVPPDVHRGFNCMIVQWGAGKVSVEAASGAVIRNRSGYYGTAGQYAAMSLACVLQTEERDAAQYMLLGDVL
jgi:hypothetical protein